MRVYRVSPFSGETNSMDINVTDDQIRAWQDGVLIQNTMPNLNPAHREFIMSGTHPSEWEKMIEKENE